MSCVTDMKALTGLFLTQSFLSRTSHWLTLLAILAIGACGGGSGSDGPPSPPNPPPNPPATYIAKVSWYAPTTRLNGSSIDNLTGYRVYYGTSYLNLPLTRIEINNPSAITWTVSELGAGTWYFAVTAIDGGGYESSFSNIVAKTFP